LLVVSASAIYFAEHEAQPGVFPNIPASLWWSVVTLTTVGYGDVYPVTVAGKFLASVIAILGIGMFALPTGILGAGLIEEMRKRKEGHPARERTARRCPRCGREIE
jgi:voltage-gated potassium channel